jgi:Cof subfamily protein (haloacid dehalogenase superfamily)
MTIRLVATDLDGTLLDSDGLIPPANRQALERALERGVYLVLATARKVDSTAQIEHLLGLPCARIVHNGARTWDWQGREIRHFRLPLDLALDIARFADEHRIGLIITIDEVNYYGGGARELYRDANDVAVRTNVEAVTGPPTRIIAAGTEHIDRLCSKYCDAPDSLVVHRYYSRVGAIESAVLTHPRASKADALAELCAANGIEAAAVLTIGDAEADVGMLQWAGIGVAMGNAMEEALAAATWIAPSHDDAGLAAAVERFVLAEAAY